MREMLLELYGHQEWADAEHWKAILATPAACADEETRTWMHHIHLVQRAFLAVLKQEPLSLTKPEDFASAEALRDYARDYHAEVRLLVEALTDAQLERTVSVPWFKKTPVPFTLRQALTQAAMHSHYHRAQNATRLRQFNAVPPTTDYISWLFKGQPKAEWGQ